MLKIKDLHVEVDGKKILKGLNLDIAFGQTHFVMGPNGAGKSTLAKVLAGHPAYIVTGGEIDFLGKNLLALAPEERALLGLFLSFQYPPELPGLSFPQFLYAAFKERQKAQGKEPLSEALFLDLFDETAKMLDLKSDFKEREENVGFSGGEKKQSEILQMALLDPKLAILDETDSGLDIDALKRVASGIEKLKKGLSLLVITHYLQLIDLLPPDCIHILVDGKIVECGNEQVATRLQKEGYRAFLS